MNIVIVGEYSGFAKYLSIGFNKIGHLCFVFSWGDVFKKIGYNDNSYLVDISNYSIWGRTIRGSHLIRRFFSGIRLSYFVRKKYKTEKADVVLVLNMAFLKDNNNIFNPFFSREMLHYILKDPQSIYLSACGNDYITNSYGPMAKKVNEYGLYKYCDDLPSQKKYYEYHASYIKKVIPVMADYSVPYRYFQSNHDYIIKETIPLPFDTHSVNKNNHINGKIKIMHGVTRPHDKGSSIIIAALEKLKREYDNIVDIMIVRRVPLAEYLRIMDEANIVIDQCYGLGYGMNAIEALAMGKVVLGGNEKENQEEFGLIENENPIITIGPNFKQIYEELEKLILDQNLIKTLSEKSRIYAEKIHDSVAVAKRYIELFERDN